MSDDVVDGLEDGPSQPDDDTGEVDGEGGGLRVSRRRAMQAALGGTTAAVVWSAPRIEGLTLAPDYAAAASCVGGSAAQHTKNSNNCGYYGDTECWGGNCCNNAAFSRNVPGGFALNGFIGGDVSGDNGIVQMTINGIDPPFQSCTVNVSGNCNNASFRGGGTFNFNNNGTQNAFIDCQGGGSFLDADTDGQIRVNVSCQCL